MACTHDAATQKALGEVDGDGSSGPLEFDWYSDEDEDCQPIYEATGRGRTRRNLSMDLVQKPFLDFNRYANTLYYPALQFKGESSDR